MRMYCLGVLNKFGVAVLRSSEVELTGRRTIKYDQYINIVHVPNPFLKNLISSYKNHYLRRIKHKIKLMQA